jgi:hypothetical protein
MYDVLYLDRASHSKLVAGSLERASAVAVARSEARRRRVGRMFLAGSETGRGGALVVIVESRSKLA